MHKSLILLAALAVSALTSTTTGGVASAQEQEMGSWCFKPKRKERYWGEATEGCCRMVGPAARFNQENKRCYGLNNYRVGCLGFYACCVDVWRSGNERADTCY
ncbi:hypothetical protein BGZ73_000948 [Actinomortierella ambigua]|nr:hypothetical protein BGZ73_000948 [Actinomortierella ambigua]